MNNKYLSDCYEIFTFIKDFIASMHIFRFILNVEWQMSLSTVSNKFQNIIFYKY